MPVRSSKPSAAAKPRAKKRSAAGTSSHDKPLRIQVSGVELAPQTKERTRRLIGRRLAPFRPSIERADVRFKDVGSDTHCRVRITVSGRAPVLVDERARGAERALTRAAGSMSRALARKPGRRGRRRSGMAYVLEESQTKPSRKSTRKSASRLKSGSKLMRRTQRRKHSPKARASRAQTQRRRSQVRR
jgi:hypothetical protein